MSVEEESLLAAKQALRQSIAVQRRVLAPDWVVAASGTAQAQVLALPEFRAASRVACYVAITGEVRTEAIITACHDRGQAVCVPAFDRVSRRYGFVDFLAGAAMARGPLGILQPEGGRAVAMVEVDFVVVPGVAFDAVGGRLGHGGGHYDRLLASGGQPFKAAVAFDFQVVERVPMGGRDVRMDAIVTDTQVIRALRPLGKG